LQALRLNQTRRKRLSHLVWQTKPHSSLQMQPKKVKEGNVIAFLFALFSFLLVALNFLIEMAIFC
jgi:hypothetical protein